MKTFSSLLLIGFLVISCEKNRDTNDMNGHQDSLNVETNTVPIPEDPELDSLNTDRTEVKRTNGAIPTEGTSTTDGAPEDRTGNNSNKIVDSVN